MKNKNIKNQDKIVINSIIDLLKIPIHKLNNSNLENLSGEYFDKIYQEVINSENHLENQDPNSKNKINKSRKNIKEKKIIKHIDENLDIETKEKQNYNIHQNNFIESNDFYIEELELSESEQENPKYISNSQNNVEINYKKLNIDKTKDNFRNNNRKMKIKYKKINTENNNITPFSNDENQIYKYGQMETPGNNDKNVYNNLYINNNLYTPMSTPKEEDKEETVIYPLKKIIFSIIYNTIFGEEVSILGSSPKLGSWDLNGALHLKWNEGNLWKGEISVEVENLKDFEFKFVIIEKGKIKYWEQGENNIVNFTGLINEFQFKKNGKYNKYEYTYNPNEASLLLKCNW